MLERKEKTLYLESDRLIHVLMCFHMTPGSVLSPLNFRQIALPDTFISYKMGMVMYTSQVYMDKLSEPFPRGDPVHVW